jgi:AcrR family transcriptional regulator
MEEMSVRDRIIATTLGLIEKEGVHGLTTRTIAREANVNIAAINYYFSSKQRLIEETLQSALDHMFSDTSGIFAQAGSSTDDILKNVMFYFLQGSLMYPGIIKAMLHEPINNNNYEVAIVQQITEFIRGLVSQTEQAMEADESAIRERIMQIFSVSIMVALLPNTFKTILGDDFIDNIDKQKKYIEAFFTVTN